MTTIWGVLRIAGCVVCFAAGAHAATFTVENTDDSGLASLRQAILDANTSIGHDTIAFAIPPFDGTVKLIGPTSILPAITDAVTIDGYTQPGASPNTLAVDQGDDAVLLIELVSINLPYQGNDCGLVVQADGCTVRGLVVNRWPQCAIQAIGADDLVVEGNFLGVDPTGEIGYRMGVSTTGVAVYGSPGGPPANNVRIGGTSPQARNVIGGFGKGWGFGVVFSGVSSSRIEGNYIGTNRGGTTQLGHGQGIMLNTTSDVTVGGIVSGARNLLVDSDMGINLVDPNPGVAVQGNFIGTDRTGSSPLSNTRGVNVNSAGALIGGGVAGAGNLIAGGGDGVHIYSSGTVVRGNFIGTGPSGDVVPGLGNATGIVVWGNADITIGGPSAADGNVIVGNTGRGISQFDGRGMTILRNAIHHNGGLGIDLGSDGNPTPNDPDDTDLGFQNFPVLAAGAFPGGTSIAATLDSTPNRTFRVEIFANAACDPSGYGEGAQFVGARDDVTTDASGDASFTVTLDADVPPGTVMTATATDLTTGDTSEFSACTAATPMTTTTTSTNSTTTVASTTTSTTALSTTVTSTSTITTTSTTPTTLPAACELLTGKKLLLRSKTGSAKHRSIRLLSLDPAITLGAGNASADDPVLHGGTLRLVTAAGDRFDDTYVLGASRWKYVKKEGANAGYTFRRTDAFKSVLIQPGKRVKIVANGVGLGHMLTADPSPVDVVLTLGEHCYCLHFGGEATFKPDKKWLAKRAPASPGCPPAPASRGR